MLASLKQQINAIETIKCYGVISGIRGMLIICHANLDKLFVGQKCIIENDIPAEIVGFEGDDIFVMPTASIQGIGPGQQVVFYQQNAAIFPDFSWQGRVISALGDPLDDLGPLHFGDTLMPLRHAAPAAFSRNATGLPMATGVRVIDTFLRCVEGQRMGIFAGSGVGKSVLLGMIASKSKVDVVVMGLIGERGREVKDYIEKVCLAKSVIVVATSDEPPLVRRQAAYTTMAVSEYFRSQGLRVLCLIDSLTRLAMAQREIGLSAGEPPTAKGYPPSVFSELAQLLERAGPGIGKEGSITGFFTVLVEGDDRNEPISDAVRGILDGHIFLDRSLAERNHFPSINVMHSLSRLADRTYSTEEKQLVRQGRKVLNIYDDLGDMIKLGAYKPGSDPEIDQAMLIHPKLMNFLSQTPEETSTIEESFICFKDIFT